VAQMMKMVQEVISFIHCLKGKKGRASAPAVVTF